MSWWSRGPPISTPVPSVNIPRSVPTRRTPVTPVPTWHPLASSLLAPVGMAPIVDIVFAPIVASHPQRTGEVSLTAKRLSVSAVEDLHGQKSPNHNFYSMHCATGRWAVRSALKFIRSLAAPVSRRGAARKSSAGTTGFSMK